jgi:acyl dehydratase
MGRNLITWDDVKEGSELPSFTYELSLLRLVAFVRASGLYDYIHFDGAYARSVGMRDAFISTPHIEGLFSRLMTDWSGPDGEIRSLTLKMNAPCCSGDILTISGKVGRKYVSDAGEHLVDLVDLVMGYPDAPTAMQASATMALPARNAPVVAATLPEYEDVPAATDGTPDFARDHIGRIAPSPQPPTRPLTEHEILLWCEALEDWNPLYWDHQYAKTTRHGGVIAPPAMGFFYGAGNAANAGIGVLRPGVDTPPPLRAGLIGLQLLQELRKKLIADNNPFVLADFPEAAVGQASEHYHRVVRPGDSLHDSYQLLSVSPLKQTRVGEGHFVTFKRITLNQHDELVKTWTLTLYMYRIKAG